MQKEECSALEFAYRNPTTNTHLEMLPIII